MLGIRNSHCPVLSLSLSCVWIQRNAIFTAEVVLDFCTLPHTDFVKFRCRRCALFESQNARLYNDSRYFERTHLKMAFYRIALEPVIQGMFTVKFFHSILDHSMFI